MKSTTTVVNWITIVVTCEDEKRREQHNHILLRKILSMSVNLCILRWLLTVVVVIVVESLHFL